MWLLLSSFNFSAVGGTSLVAFAHFHRLQFIILVRQLHREFLRAGADVIQAFTFSMDDEIIDEKVMYYPSFYMIVRDWEVVVVVGPGGGWVEGTPI